MMMMMTTTMQDKQDDLYCNTVASFTVSLYKISFRVDGDCSIVAVACLSVRAGSFAASSESSESKSG